MKILKKVSNIEDLANIFETALHNFSEYVYIEVTIPKQKETEYIVNKRSSILNKLEYYKNTYDENLIHKNCKEIKIISAGYVQSYIDLED